MTERISADVAIIGGGIMGASAALFLRRMGLSVVLLGRVVVLRLSSVVVLLLDVLLLLVLLVLLPLSVVLLRLSGVVVLRVSSSLLLRRAVVRLRLHRHLLAGDQVAVHRAARGNGGTNLVKAERGSQGEMKKKQ